MPENARRSLNHPTNPRLCTSIAFRGAHFSPLDFLIERHGPCRAAVLAPLPTELRPSR